MSITPDKAEKKSWLFRQSVNNLLIPTWKQCWVVVHRHPTAKISIYTECVLEGEAFGQCVVDLFKVQISHKPKFSLLAKAFQLHKSKPFDFELIIDNTSTEHREKRKTADFCCKFLPRERTMDWLPYGNSESSCKATCS